MRYGRVFTPLPSGTRFEKMGSVIAILGNAGGTNVGESLRRAAISAGHSVQFFNAYEAVSGNRLLRALTWRFADRRPLRLDRVEAEIIAACATACPDILIATGAAPLTERSLHTLRGLGIFCINYATDDPWNPTQSARWHLRALPAYNMVFTPRRANLNDIRRLGCVDVHYLPFGYDETLFAPPDGPINAPVHDVLFVGGADRDRVAFMTEFMRLGPSVALVGAYWDRFSGMRHYALGHKPPETLRDLTAAAKVNLCLVRRANRDGHVMRSFEIGAAGGCMLAEDTDEHREIFGPEGEAVVYFRHAEEAAARARALLCDLSERRRLAAGLHRRVVGGAHTYAHRLATMLCIANGG
jgi:spore maturation protein CgeB